MNPFYRLADFLISHMKKEMPGDTERKFEIQRLADVLTVLFAGLCITVLAQIFLTGDTSLTEDYVLSRPQKGQGDQQMELEASIEDETETELLELTLKERQYSTKEKEEFLKQALESLDQEILGENVSPDEVRGKVNLPEKLLDGKVTLQWTQTPTGLLEDDGSVIEEISEEGELLQLHADLECDGLKGFYECALKLYPPKYTDQEKLWRAVEKSVEAADEASAQEETMILPRVVEGKKIHWQTQQSSTLGLWIMLTLAAAVGVWVGKDRQRKNQQEARSRQLLMDYPTILFQLSMLLNAGLTMQNAFFKIALEYRNRKKKKKHYAYEEMVSAYYEMQSGISEARAYENFGKRCGESVYIKLGSMLSGNLQKGSEGLAKLLQEEADLSMEDRRRMAKKLGEEAGTKMLAPMMLMLLIVLVILMVPALIAF